MIRLNWEEALLLVLFSSMLGTMLTEGKYWSAAACAVWVALLLTAGSRRPQDTRPNGGTT